MVHDTVAQDLLRSDHLSRHASMVLLQEPSGPLPIPAWMPLTKLWCSWVTTSVSLLAGDRRAAQGSIA